MRITVRLGRHRRRSQVHVPERRPEQHGAEDEERHGAEDLAGLLDQVPDLAAAPSPERAEHDTPDERGDEPGAAERVCDSEGEAGAGQRHDLQPGATDEPAPAGEHDDAAAATPASTPASMP